MEKIVSGHDKAPGIATCTVLCALMNTLRDEGLLTPDDLRRPLVALLHPQQPLASFAVGAMLGDKSVKHGKDGTADREIGHVDGFQHIRHGGGALLVAP